MEALMYLVYGIPMLLIWAFYVWRKAARQRQNIRARDDATQAGLTQPTSLHPVIDPNRCIGSGACISACPEGTVLGLVARKAQLIEPTTCIGHGACMAACPMDAITLVFGTAERGVDIPFVTPQFETNVPGMFIAGELGGMGLIRNAIKQGSEAMDAIRKLDGLGRADRLDVVIIGAGPAGIAASLGAIAHKLRYRTIEQDTMGGTVAHFPRGKVVMTAPAELPLIGQVKFSEVSKETLLAFWNDVQKKTGLKIHTQERMEDIQPVDGGFIVKTTQGSHLTRAVLLAIGRRGTPRKLDVPGEELSKVVYRLVDPQQYRNQHVLVVGGGDSALEAAASIAEEPGTQVTLSYRSEAFGRAKQKNRNRIAAAEQTGRLRVMLKSETAAIMTDAVLLKHAGRTLKLRNDAVIVCAGGILPTPFLKQIGIEVNTKYGTP